MGVVGDKWTTIRRPHLQDKRDKWKTTAERQQGNNMKQLGDGWKTLGDTWKTILEDSWELWKTIPGNTLETTSGNIWETTGRHLGDHMWETAGRPHPGDGWKTSSERETED